MGLFGGKTDSQPTSATKPAARPQTTVPSRETMEAPTVIGEHSVVKGELESRTDMLVEGRVEGQIKGAKRVIIGEKGDVEARVQAEVVIVRGTVNGELEGNQKVEIAATGKVFGNITSRAIVVAEGATFRGSSKMAHSTPAGKASAPSTGSSVPSPASSSSLSSSSSSSSTSTSSSDAATAPTSASRPS